MPTELSPNLLQKPTIPLTLVTKPSGSGGEIFTSDTTNLIGQEPAIDSVNDTKSRSAITPLSQPIETATVGTIAPTLLTPGRGEAKDDGDSIDAFLNSLTTDEPLINEYDTKPTTAREEQVRQLADDLQLFITGNPPSAELLASIDEADKGESPSKPMRAIRDEDIQDKEKRTQHPRLTEFMLNPAAGVSRFIVESLPQEAQQRLAKLIEAVKKLGRKKEKTPEKKLGQNEIDDGAHENTPELQRLVKDYDSMVALHNEFLERTRRAKERIQKAEDEKNTAQMVLDQKVAELKNTEDTIARYTTIAKEKHGDYQENEESLRSIVEKLAPFKKQIGEELYTALTDPFNKDGQAFDKTIEALKTLKVGVDNKAKARFKRPTYNIVGIRHLGANDLSYALEKILVFLPKGRDAQIASRNASTRKGELEIRVSELNKPGGEIDIAKKEFGDAKIKYLRIHEQNEQIANDAYIARVQALFDQSAKIIAKKIAMIDSTFSLDSGDTQPLTPISETPQITSEPLATTVVDEPDPDKGATRPVEAVRA